MKICKSNSLQLLGDIPVNYFIKSLAKLMI